MAHVRRYLLTPIALAALCVPPLAARKFYDDDPIRREPPPIRVGQLKEREVSDAYDVMVKSFRQVQRKSPQEIPPAGAVNTLGETPDSAWHQNRHGAMRMSLAELVQGPARGNMPSTDRPWTVLSGKTEGATPGLFIRDSRGRRFVLKFDPTDNPGMTTAADVIGSKLFYALGYNVPENYIVRFLRPQLALAAEATFVDQFGRIRRMKDWNLDGLLSAVPREPDGSYRAMASLFVEGEIIGPFLYEGTRSDDPNDIVAHEHRRDLRGLYVFAAWLGHHDATALNTLDAVVEENGLRYVRHHLIDFGSILGSSARGPRDAREEHLYLFDFLPAGIQLATLGLHVAPWMKIRYPELPEIGRFEASTFDPRNFRPIYPNPAFDNRLPEDTYWAAKKVMAFSDAEIRAIVETGEFRDRRAEDFLTETLIARRDRIGKTFFSDVLPLDDFQVRAGRLEFEDLAVKYGFESARSYSIRWFRFDNLSEKMVLLAGEDSFSLPNETIAAPPDAYYAAEIYANGREKKVIVYLRREQGGGAAAVGIERLT